ncbi:hypothetical protein I3842_14G034900 [Carya illinoinensis]|uniref:Uncharacterized protein n=1 Tax=Carya illinoinensis TaxID=32201 RepID=A0A922AEY4_CARIL|nr:hypothetical protein I3842_14G034900 [Carya illinoinensis]
MTLPHHPFPLFLLLISSSSSSSFLSPIFLTVLILLPSSSSFYLPNHHLPRFILLVFSSSLSSSSLSPILFLFFTLHPTPHRPTLLFLLIFSFSLLLLTSSYLPCRHLPHFLLLNSSSSSLSLCPSPNIFLQCSSASSPPVFLLSS